MRQTKLNNTFITLATLLLFGFSNLKSQVSRSYPIDSLYAFKDSCVFKKYDSVYQSIMSINNKLLVDSIEYSFELFTYTWSGYHGISKYSVFRFNDKQGCYVGYNKLNDLELNSANFPVYVKKNKIKNIFKGTTLFDLCFDIDKGFSYGWHQYIVLKWNGKIVFCRVSYSEDIIGDLKPYARFKNYLSR